MSDLAEKISLGNISPELIEIASWRVVSEFCRRYPGQFQIIETHPGGGQYDCLTLVSKEGQSRADFNRQGRFHVHMQNGETYVEPLDVWSMMVSSEYDVKAVLDRVCRSIGLPIPAKLPASTPEVITYRFISAFLSHTVFGREPWECRNGIFDTASEGGGIRRKAFEKFQGALPRLDVRLPRDVLGKPAYRFWFLMQGEDPRLCLETTGQVWLEDGSSYQLMDLYKKNRRIWPAVFEIAGNLLP